MPPKPPNKRLSLVERQQKLLEADGFSKTSLPTPSSSSSSSYLSLATDFRARQDAHLLRRGMANAASVSRVAVDFSQDANVDDHDNLLEELEFKQTEEDNEDDDSKKSVVAARSTNTSTSSRYSRYSRHAPSIHPSLSGLSEASSSSSSSSCSIVRYSTITR